MLICRRKQLIIYVLLGWKYDIQWLSQFISYDTTDYKLGENANIATDVYVCNKTYNPNSYYIHTDCKILNTDTPFKPLLILLYIIVYETTSVKNETFMTYSINLLTYMSLYIG